MPEGDTLRRIAAVLERGLLGRVVTGFEAESAPLTASAENARLVGRSIESVRAVGKHCLISFSGGLVLRTHLPMNGSWHLYRPLDRWRMPRSEARLVLRTEEAVAVGFRIPVAELVREEDLRRGPLARLGPDLLDPGFDEKEALARLAADPGRSAGEVLLDQRVLAGIGNGYKSEILFEAKVHPERRVGALDVPVLRRILEVARKQLSANVRQSPIARRGRNTTGSLRPGASLFVYGRAGAPCRRCGTAIVLLRQSSDARVTFVCPSCQPLA